MKFKRLFLGFLTGLLLVFSMSLVNPGMQADIVYAVDLGDDVDGGSSIGSSDDNAIADVLKGHQPVTDEQMQMASEWTKPITDFFGNLIGIGICLLTGVIFVITILDLCYIAVPITRSLLYKDAGAGGSGSVGMPGGYGRGGYGAGGYGVGGMDTSPSGQTTWQLVSDEAVQCAVLMNNNQHMPQAGTVGMPGQPTGQQVGNMQTKSVILTYFKKRVFFMILFGVCLITLTSSLFLGTGVNIANLIMRLVETLNGYIM